MAKYRTVSEDDWHVKTKMKENVEVHKADNWTINSEYPQNILQTGQSKLYLLLKHIGILVPLMIAATLLPDRNI